MLKFLAFLVLLPFLVQCELKCYKGASGSETSVTLDNSAYCVRYSQCLSPLVNGACQGTTVLTYGASYDPSTYNNGYNYDIYACNKTNYCNAPPGISQCYSGWFLSSDDAPDQTLNRYNLTCYSYKSICTIVYGPCTQTAVNNNITLYTYGVATSQSCSSFVTNTKITNLKCCQGSLCNTIQTLQISSNNAYPMLGISWLLIISFMFLIF